MKQRKAVFIIPREEHPTLYYFVPLAILSFAGKLQQLGYETAIIDAKLEEDNFCQRVAEEAKDAHLLWASGKIGRQLEDLIAGMKAAKEVNPDLPVLFGGWHASLEPASTIASPYIDIVVRRQAEEAICEVAEALWEGKDLGGIPGLTYKKNGEVKSTPDRPWDRDMDKILPLPYHLIDMERYITGDGKGLKMVKGAKRSINYTSSRGCHGRCAFCHITTVCEKKWFAASPERVLDDLELLKEKYQIDGIDFHDSNFFTGKRRAEKIMQGMIDRKLEIKWRTSVRVDQILKYGDDTFKLMKDSGAVEMAVGGESASQRVMDLIQKDITPQMVKDCSLRLVSHGIDPVYSIIVGFPDEKDWADSKKTLTFMAELRELMPDAPIEYFYYTPFPGTPLFEYAEKTGGLKRPKTLDGWTIYSPYDPNMPWVDDELAYIMKIAKTFYFRFAVPDHSMKERMRSHRFRLAIRLLAFVSRYRVQNGKYGFPIEYKLARFVKDVVIGKWGFFKKLREIL